MNIQQAILTATKRLQATSPSARMDVEALLMYVLDVTQAELYAYSDEQLDEEQIIAFMRLLKAREEGAPIAYLLGRKEFWSLDLRVTPSTLIPRSETELLVEKSLSYFPVEAHCKVLELGTGSGAISLALAHERPHWHIVATDIDQDALAVAESNVERHRCQNIVFQQSDWYQDIYPEAFDMIISNPPYIADAEIGYMSPEVHYEPKRALFAEDNGMQALNLIVSDAERYLSEGGWILLEHGFQQALNVRKLLKNNNFTKVGSHQDLAKIERITTGQKL